MFCKNCGINISDGASFCQNCGCPVGQGSNNCSSCGSRIQPDATFCAHCGAPQNNSYTQAPPVCRSCGAELAPEQLFCTVCGTPVAQPVNMEKGPSRMLCGFMGIFLGAYGVHHFIMGNTKLGVRNVILSACSVVTCGVTGVIATVFGIIDGVKIFKGVINTDAQGRKLS